MSHAGEVARLAYFIAWELKRLKIRQHVDPGAVAALGLLHDEAETITGDAPGSVKRLWKDADRSLKRLERRATHYLFEDAPEDLRAHLRGLVMKAGDYTSLASQVCRYADDVAALSYALHQVRGGNFHMAPTAQAIAEVCAARPWRWLHRLRKEYPELP